MFATAHYTHQRLGSARAIPGNLAALAGALLLLFTLASPAEEATGESCSTGEACQHCSHHGGMSDGDGMAMIENAMADMALTDSQKQEYLALTEMYRPRFKEIAERGKAGRQGLLAMAPDDPGYRDAAAAVSAEAGAAAAEVVILLAELQGNAYALLSTDQKATFLRLRAEQRQKMEERKAEYEARRAAGEPFGYGGKKHHSCKACEWLENDDREQAEAAGSE